MFVNMCTRKILKAALALAVCLTLIVAGAAAPLLARPAAAYALSAADFEDGDSPFYIYVEKGSHTLTVFGKDADGHYTEPLRTFPTATGRSSRMTPAGVFKKGGVERWHSWGSSYSPYASAYYPGLYVHGPLYRNRDFASLIASSVTQIGTNASSGCLRTTAEAAYFVYGHCPDGTAIHIVEGSPMGFAADKAQSGAQYADPAALSLNELLPEYQAMLDAQEQSASAKLDAAAVGGITVSERRVRLKAPPEGGDTPSEFSASSSTAALSADVDTGEAVLWLTNDPGVVTVGHDGRLRAVAPGHSRVVALSADGLGFDSCMITVVAAENGREPRRRRIEDPGFADMRPSHWAYDTVAALASKGIIKGEAGSFRPDDRITTAEFIRLLLAASDAATGTVPSFGDRVNARREILLDNGAFTHWFDPYYSVAASAGIVAEADGLSGAFDTGCLTRGDMALYIGRAGWFVRPAPASNLRPLAGETGTLTADEAIEQALARGFVSAYSDETYRADAFVTRAEASVIINNILTLANRSISQVSDQ